MRNRCSTSLKAQQATSTRHLSTGILPRLAGLGCLVFGGLLLPLAAAHADQVVSDDQIVQGSLCVGSDCVNGEVFGFDTIRPKGNNLRLRFEDTSTIAGFPTTDWEITINDADGQGSGNYFAVTDADSGRQVFRIDAGAPQLSLNIDAGGNLNLTSATARIANVADAVSGTDLVNLHTLNLTLTPSWVASSSDEAAHASGPGATAIGGGATAAAYDTAIGSHAAVTADSSVAVGASSLVRSPDSVAIGAYATVEADAPGGTAIGRNARVTAGAANSVALGHNSLATEPDTVSIGSPGSGRRLTNVTAGIHSTDAINVGQLQQVSSRVAANVRNIAVNARQTAANSQAIYENSQAIAVESYSIGQLQAGMEESFAGIAAAAALITITPSAPGKTTINFGVAEFQHEKAVGLALVHRLKPLFGYETAVTCGLSSSDREIVSTVGGVWYF